MGRAAALCCAASARTASVMRSRCVPPTVKLIRGTHAPVCFPFTVMHRVRSGASRAGWLSSSRVLGAAESPWYPRSDRLGLPPCAAGCALVGSQERADAQTLGCAALVPLVCVSAPYRHTLRACIVSVRLVAPTGGYRADRAWAASEFKHTRTRQQGRGRAAGGPANRRHMWAGRRPVPPPCVAL